MGLSMRFSFSFAGCFAALFAVSGCSSDKSDKGSTVTGDLRGQDGQGSAPLLPDGLGPDGLVGWRRPG